MMQPDFEIGDHVLYILDGDIGVVADIDHGRDFTGNCPEPYYVEWYFHPEQDGWHSAFDRDDSSYRVMVPLGG